MLHKHDYEADDLDLKRHEYCLARNQHHENVLKLILNTLTVWLMLAFGFEENCHSFSDRVYLGGKVLRHRFVMDLTGGDFKSHDDLLIVFSNQFYLHFLQNCLIKIL